MLKSLSCLFPSCLGPSSSLGSLLPPLSSSSSSLASRIWEDCERVAMTCYGENEKEENNDVSVCGGVWVARLNKGWVSNYWRFKVKKEAVFCW